MDIWWATVPLAGLTILVIALVTITCLALKDTASEDRAGILHAIAACMRELRGRR
ncbi:hypothetical protein [Streptomyces sp. NPDC058291]|jgi:hypothetical protein|uniref:hypothetical protein n=1 Tax=Streptomyces sp. NPDC058291 TaxID=3346427 RepID=UPI0036E0826C